MLTLTQQMILGKQNKTKKEVSRPPQLLNLENALDLKTFSGCRTSCECLFSANGEMIQKIRLSWCLTKKIQREVQLFTRKRLNQAKAGWTCRRLFPMFRGFVVEKIERLAITTDGKMFVSTDNDGVNESSGQTFFWSIGKIH